MIRQTSIDTYHAIKQQGLLSNLRFEIYQVLFDHGPLTSGELWSEHLKNQQRQSLTPRFAEMKELGVIFEAETRPCRMTGQTCIAWDVTSQLPKKIEKMESKKIWYGVFIQERGARHKIFRSRKDAEAYKFESGITGLIHEFEQIGK